MKEGSAARLVLTIEERTAKDDATRIAALKGHFNGLIQTLKSAQFTDVKGTKPAFAESKDESDDLAEVAESLKEPKEGNSRKGSK
jgi:hypothetical protein